MALKHYIIQPQDEKFFGKLKAWLDKAAQEAGSEKAVWYPVLLNTDGSINRTATLEMFYSDMPLRFLES